MENIIIVALVLVIGYLLFERSVLKKEVRKWHISTNRLNICGRVAVGLLSEITGRNYQSVMNEVDAKGKALYEEMGW